MRNLRLPRSVPATTMQRNTTTPGLIAASTLYRRYRQYRQLPATTSFSHPLCHLRHHLVRSLPSAYQPAYPPVPQFVPSNCQILTEHRIRLLQQSARTDSTPTQPNNERIEKAILVVAADRYYRYHPAHNYAEGCLYCHHCHHRRRCCRWCRICSCNNRNTTQPARPSKFISQLIVRGWIAACIRQ